MLPDDVTALVARGVGAYIRAAQEREVPAALRRLRSFRPNTLRRHSGELVAALDDGDFRARVVDWLNAGKTPLTGKEAAALRLAVERPDGWEEKLAARSAGTRAAPADSQTDGEDLLERERAKVKRARSEARRLKDEGRRALEAAEARVLALAEENDRLRAALAAAEARAGTASAEGERARADATRESRKARREVEAARAERDASRRELRAGRREAAGQGREIDRLASTVARLEARLAARGEAPAPKEPAPPPAARRRRPLDVPQGRLAEDPQVLDEWLGAGSVTLLVDGYNVTLAEGGFGGVALEQQRARLVEEIAGLAGRKGLSAIVVFDGSDVTVPPLRRRRGKVKIEYSRPGETADDHLVALVAELPPDPVIVATNDRELQDRVARHGATVATATQLLAVLR